VSEEQKELNRRILATIKDEERTEIYAYPATLNPHDD